MILNEKPQNPVSWMRFGTIANGFCGYHAVAEILATALRFQPELVRPVFWTSNLPFYQEFRKKLQVPLLLDDDFTVDDLTQAMQIIPPGKSFRFLVPTLISLTLSYYHTVITPARKRFLDRSKDGLASLPQQETSAEKSNFLEQLAQEIALEALEHVEYFGAASDQEREALAHELSLWFEGQEDEHTHCEQLTKKLSVIDELLRYPAFDILARSGLEPEEYPSLHWISLLTKIFFQPLALEQETLRPGVIHHNIVSLCLVCSKEQMSEPAIYPHYFAIYHCSVLDHFEYGISRQYLENVRKKIKAQEAATIEEEPVATAAPQQDDSLPPHSSSMLLSTAGKRSHSSAFINKEGRGSIVQDFVKKFEQEHVSSSKRRGSQSSH